MPDFRRLRDDLRAFAEACGFPMAPWQAEGLALRQRVTVSVAASRSGSPRASRPWPCIAPSSAPIAAHGVRAIFHLDGEAEPGGVKEATQLFRKK